MRPTVARGESYCSGSGGRSGEGGAGGGEGGGDGGGGKGGGDGGTSGEEGGEKCADGASETDERREEEDERGPDAIDTTGETVRGVVTGETIEAEKSMEGREDGLENEEG